MRCFCTIMVLIIQALSFVFGIASSILLLVNYFFCARQCLLFGRVNEVARVQTSGPRLCCLMCITFGFITSIAALLIVLERLEYRRRIRLSPIQVVILTGICAVMMSTDASIITHGFYKWCSSLKYYSCSHKHIHFMDWKMFKPRYNDCSGAWLFLTLSSVFAWSSFVAWCLMAIISGIKYALK